MLVIILGVQFEANEREPLLPPQKRYIQSVITKGAIELVVTMHPGIAKYIH